MPKVTLDQAVIDLMESIALQETALSHILCAESQKMKVAMGLDGLDLCKLLEVNDSATNMVHAVANLELVLKDKLEFISNNLYYPPSGSGCSADQKALCLPGCRAGIFVYRLFTESLHKNRKMHLLELLRRSICAIL